MNGDEPGDAFFRPFDFPATTPFIGRLSARFRSAWYGVAALGDDRSAGAAFAVCRPGQ